MIDSKCRTTQEIGLGGCPYGAEIALYTVMAQFGRYVRYIWKVRHFMLTTMSCYVDLNSSKIGPSACNSEQARPKARRETGNKLIVIGKD